MLGTHVRRKFHDLEQAHGSPLAREALERIAALYAVEDEIRGRPPDERKPVRQTGALPLLQSLHDWFEVALTKLSRKSETTAAIRYALTLWPALTRYCDDGRLEIDNNAAEGPDRSETGFKRKRLTIRWKQRRHPCVQECGAHLLGYPLFINQNGP